jgi:hypothetical protein
LKPKYHAQIPYDYPFAQRPKIVRNFGKTNKRGPQKWVPKDKIIYVTNILNNSVETPIMVLGQWILMTRGGKKVYIPRFGT